MSNAMHILGDTELIHLVCYEGKLLKHRSSDSYDVWFLKNFINNRGVSILNFYNSYYGLNYNYSSNNRTSATRLLELKVNHYRQKFWCWTPLKNK